MRRMFLSLCTNVQFSERRANTSLAFENHKLKQVRKMQNDAPSVDYKTTSSTQVYHMTVQNLHFDQDS